jgi:two-component system CheB/CheR fusion protein
MPESDPAPHLSLGICISSGDLGPLRDFLSALPLGANWAALLVSTPGDDPAFPTADQVKTMTPWPVELAEAGSRIRPGVLHLLPSTNRLQLRHGHLVPIETPAAPVSSERGPLDVFLHSLAADTSSRAAAVILSGPDTDGADGARAIATAGGIVLAQDPASAAFDARPRAAMATGAVRACLPAAALPRYLVEELALPGEFLDPGTRGPSAGDVALIDHGPVLDLLRARYRLDFTPYRPGTLDRRIRRRMSLVECADAESYASLLRARPDELENLRHDLLIGVTEFFREPEAFAWLAEHVLPELFRSPEREEFRAWCAGCATGEEAYSLAILLDEVARAAGYRGRITVFATDANPVALQTATLGRYEDAKLQGIGPERLARYFISEREGQRRVTPALRAHVVFAPHDLLADPPFTRLDLILCRNLLIYLQPEAQERLIVRLHQALHSGGVLFLGASESLGRHARAFTTLDARHKLFRKTDDRRLIPEDRRPPAYTPPAPLSLLGSASAQAAPPPGRHLLRAYDHLLQRHAPSGYLVDASGVLVHCFGDAGLHLSPPEGRVENHLLTRTSGDLRLALSTLLPRALRGGVPVEARGVRVNPPGTGPQLLDLVAEAIPDTGHGPALVHVALLHPRAAAGPAADAAADVEPFAAEAARTDRLAELEAELQTAHESLQNTVEQLQIANEELQSAHEEQLAANEELQAANEELHSLNEELQAVNDDFERKNRELQQLNADLDNLLGALEVGTLFLDRDLRIRKFNAAINRCFHLLPQDIGRPIAHIAYPLDDQQRLLADAARVAATGHGARRELRSRDGQWFLQRILPFRDAQGSIDGVVITFADVTAMRQMQDRFDLAIEASRLVWWDWDVAQDQLSTHTAGSCILGYEHDGQNHSGANWLECVHPDDRARVRDSLETALRGDLPVWDCEHRFRTRTGDWLWVSSKGRITERDHEGKALRMVGTTQDIDARKSAELALARDLELLAHVPDAVICVNPAGLVTYWNHAATELYGWHPAELLGRPLVERLPPETSEEFAAALEGALAGRDFNGEVEDLRKDGTRIWVHARSHRLLDEEGRLFGLMAIARDVSDARRDREEHARMERQLAQSQKMETLGNLAGGIAHDFNNLLAAILGYAEIASDLLTEDHPALSKLSSVRHAGQRAAELVRRILAFSRAGEHPRRPIRVAQVLEETLPLIRASLPSTLEIRSRVTPDADHTVLGDHTQIQQVLLNLCTNAAQAIGSRSGGRLEITLEPVHLECPPPLHAGAIAPGPALLLTIADNGGGISPEVMERIFEPFFTTKPVGEGTGLGLSIVHSIVAAHGGGIAVDSLPGAGTSFRLYLPALSPSTESLPPPPLPRMDSSAFPLGHGERVAVIDDEESVALLTQQALERYGYSAEIMPDAPTCLEALRARPDAYSLVVSDQTMPLMTGLELVQALRAASIRTPVLILSGYSRALEPHTLPALGRVGFLAKPFVLADLLEHVNAIVRPPPSGH